MGRLDGRIAIVTGAGSREGIGNGKAAAILFAREGAKVLVADRDAEAGAETKRIILGEGGSAEAVQADVTDPSQCKNLVNACLSLWGRLDVLHNNVGDTSRGTVTDISIMEWDRVMTLNVTSMVMMSQAAIPAMIESGGGSIVNISSISGLRPRAGHGGTAYSVSKGAIIALTKAMAIDHAPDGIRVNCLAPGPMFTPRVVSKGMTPELREARRMSTPLQVEGNAWDVGFAAVFLASVESRFITGVTIPIDGGVTAGRTQGLCRTAALAAPHGSQ